jgi:hypothetical protein
VVAFTADGTRVAVGDGRRVVVFDPGSTDPPDAREYHAGEATGVTFGPDGTVWTGGEDRLVYGRAPGEADPRFQLRGSPNALFRLAVSPDGAEVVAASADVIGNTGRLYRFDVAARRADVWRFAGGDRIGMVVAVSPDGTRVAALDGMPTGQGDFRFVVRDLATGRERRAEVPGPWLFGTFRPDGGMVVAGTPQGPVVLDRDAPASRRSRRRSWPARRTGRSRSPRSGSGAIPRPAPGRRRSARRPSWCWRRGRSRPGEPGG